MHRISRKAIAVVGVVGALAAGGAAYTNSLGNSGDVASGTEAGYASVDVNGATLNGITYTFDNTGQNITAVNLVFDTSTTPITGDIVKVGFNDSTTLSTCDSAAPAPAGDGNTSVTCTVTPEPTSSTSKVDVLVTNPS